MKLIISLMFPFFTVLKKSFDNCTRTLPVLKGNFGPSDPDFMADPEPGAIARPPFVSSGLYADIIGCFIAWGVPFAVSCVVVVFCGVDTIVGVTPSCGLEDDIGGVDINTNN